jgi:DNA-binding GntR family transcriptional regulator
MSKAAEHAYRTIRESILSGEFAPNSRLKETELVEKCGYSRTPVREALRRLAAEDFIAINRNQGAQVKAWSAAEIDDLFQLRALLEGYTAARASHHISLIQLNIIQDAIHAMDAVLASDKTPEKKMEDFLEFNQIVHTTVWEAAGSERLERMLTHLIEQALVIRTARKFSIERIAQSHNHHEELLKALKAGDAEWAESIMSSHIHAARHALQPPVEP